MHTLDPSLRGIQRRQRLYAVMHLGRGHAGRAFNAALALLIVTSVAIIPLEWIEGLDRFSSMLLAVESFIVGLFTMEYFLRIYCAPRRAKYVFSFWGIVDLLSIAPFYAGISGVQIIRAVRFFKLGSVEPSAASDRGRSLERGIGLLPNERIEYIATKHPLILFLGCMPVAVSIGGALATFAVIGDDPIGVAVGAALIAFALVLFWRTWLDYSYDVIYITNLRLVFQNQHLLGKSVNQVGYNAITNVKPQYDGVFSYVFRYGTLIVDTAAESPGQISMKFMRKHEKAAHAIMRQLGAQGRIGSMEIN